MPKIETPEEFASKLSDRQHTSPYIASLVVLRDAAIRAESSELLRVCGEALAETTRQLEAMNQSSAHAASWVEPRSHGTTERIKKNKSALAALREAGVLDEH